MPDKGGPRAVGWIAAILAAAAGRGIGKVSGRTTAPDRTLLISGSGPPVTQAIQSGHSGCGPTGLPRASSVSVRVPPSQQISTCDDPAI